MLNISSFLQKFHSALGADKEKRSILCTIFKDVLKVELEEKSFSLKGDVLYVKATPSLKSEIFMHKKEILEKISAVSPKLFILDIR